MDTWNFLHGGHASFYSVFKWHTGEMWSTRSVSLSSCGTWLATLYILRSIQLTLKPRKVMMMKTDPV